MVFSYGLSYMLFHWFIVSLLMQVAATPDLMLAYVDFFLGGDEKRPDLPPRLHQRFPMCLVFGGDGSYMAPFFLHSDNVLTSLMSQVFCLINAIAVPYYFSVLVIISIILRQ